MTVDHARACTAEARRRRYAGLSGEGVGDRVILPRLEERRADVTRGITTHQVDLPVKVTRCHEGAHIRHRRPGAPDVGGDVVDPGGINHVGEGDLLTAEDEELVHIGRIHA